MEQPALAGDEDAVSSVLGVVLMVAVTIILAAVIGTFVLGIGGDLTDSSPSVEWDVSPDVDSDTSRNDSVAILHGGGDAVERGTLEVTIDGETVYQDGQVVHSDLESPPPENFPERLTAGARLNLKETSGDGPISPGSTLRIIWQTEDSSAVLVTETLN